MTLRNFDFRPLCLSFALLGIAGCDTMAKTGKSAEATPTIANVSRKDLVGYIYFDGKVFTPPGSHGIAYAPYSLTVSEVYTSVGKRVSKGSTMAKLAIPSAEANVAAAEANLKATRAAYAASRSTYDAPVIEARKALQEARETERLARAAAASGASTDLQSAIDARVAAEENLRIAEAEVGTSTLSERQAVAIASEYLAEARAGASEARVRAPISGTVTTFDPKPGMPVKAMQPLATVVDLHRLQIQGIVPPEHADAVKVGTTVLISLEGPNSDPFEGRVTDVSVLPPSKGQQSPGYLAVIKFDNSRGIVQSGAKIKRLGVRTGKVENALVVPVGALSKDENGKTIVFVQKSGNWVATPVEVGISDGALAEIKSGVTEGDIVRVVPPAPAAG